MTRSSASYRSSTYTLHVNGKRYVHNLLIYEIDLSRSLLLFLANQAKLPKIYWQGRDGLEIAGLGSVLNLKTFPLFQSDNDSPAQFFGGRAFSPQNGDPLDPTWKDFSTCRFFLPKLQIIRQGGKTTLTAHTLFPFTSKRMDISKEVPPDLPPFNQNPFDQEPCREEIQFENREDLPDRFTWNKMVEEALDHIQKKRFDKVVLGHRSTYALKEKTSPFVLLGKLKAPGSIRFAFQFKKGSIFIGATPERLYLRQKRTLFAEAIAGTRKRGKTKKEDAHLAQELLSNAKEQLEFSLVKTSIREALFPLSTSLDCAEKISLTKTPHVQHLYTPLRAQLKDEISDREIVEALHPTAAVGGYPKGAALEHLMQEEPFSRGWYASPLGYIGEEKAELAVGIRSALCEKTRIHLFAATGIVTGSSPDAEWEELNSKMSMWTELKGKIQEVRN